MSANNGLGEDPGGHPRELIKLTFNTVNEPQIRSKPGSLNPQELGAAILWYPFVALGLKSGEWYPEDSIKGAPLNFANDLGAPKEVVKKEMEAAIQKGLIETQEHDNKAGEPLDMRIAEAGVIELKDIKKIQPELIKNVELKVAEYKLSVIDNVWREVGNERQMLGKIREPSQAARYTTIRGLNRYLNELRIQQKDLMRQMDAAEAK